MNTIQYVPIIQETDYIIVGGGLKEAVMGLCLAKNQRRVLMVVKETYLAKELCLGNRYIKAYPDNQENLLFQQLFPEDVIKREQSDSGKGALLPDQFKRNMEEVCEQYGVSLLYNVMPLDVITQGEQKYLRIGGKFGICSIACKEVLDLNGNNQVFHNHYCMELLNMPSLHKEVTMSIKGKTKEYEISLYPGSYEDHHAVLSVPCEEIQFKSKADYLVACKQRCLEVLQWLKEKDTEYSEIQPGRFAEDGYSLEYDYLKEMKRGWDLAQKLLELELSGEDITTISNSGNAVCTHSMQEFTTDNMIYSEDVQTELLAYNPTIEDRNYKTLSGLPIWPMIKCNYDVIVVGGGTSGAMAALHAARKGLNTLLLEMNEELGGTGTIGGVSTYWFGKRYHDVMEIDKEIQNIYDLYSIERSAGIWSSYDDCNPGIKSLILTELCRKAGVTIVYHALSFGIIKESTTGRITGVTAITKEGAKGFFGSYIVDATGDGDIATFAGASACYGSARDHITYWGSLAQYTSPAKYRNNFSSTLMVSDPVDYTRFIMIGRCRGEHTYDHGTYVSTRESRHIQGLYEIDLKDLVSFRTYEDGIYTCFSNYDPKGKLSADMVYAGVLPPQISIQIPLRALLPVDQSGERIPGIILAGKAISCTHNAFPSIRMQPDLMHQGTVIACVLAEAIQTATDLTKLDVVKLRRIISEYTGDPLTLPKFVLSLEEIAQTVSIQDRSHWVDYPFTAEVITEEKSLRIMCAESKQILPFLEKRYREGKENGMNLADLERIAGYLLWHGSDTGTQLLLDSIIKEIRETQELPIREASTQCAQLLPDHGVMPEVVYRMNLLAWSKFENIMEPFALVLKRLQNMNRDYMDIRKGIYHYIDAFAYVAERTGNKSFVPLLIQLKELKEFDHSMHGANKASLLTERLLILLLSINRALARCGEREGYEGLIRMLDIDSLPIAASACRELEALTGETFGLDASRWKMLLEQNKEPLQVKIIEDKVW